MSVGKKFFIFDVNSVQRCHAADVFHKADLLSSLKNIQSYAFVHCNRKEIKTFADKSGNCVRQIKVKKML